MRIIASEKELSGLIEKLLEETGRKKGAEEGGPTPASGGEKKSATGDEEYFSEAEMTEDKDNQTSEQLPPGTARVQNNEIIVEAISGENKLPTLIPTKGINLFVNGKPVKKQIKVSSGDYIYLELPREERSPKIVIQRSQDNLRAFIHVTMKSIKQYRLKDQPARETLILITTDDTEKSFPFSLQDIISKLEEEGITYGKDYRAIQKLLENTSDGKFEIARGLMPKEPVDDSLSIMFEEKLQKHQTGSKEKVNFYDIGQIPSVDENTLLAVKHEGKPGQAGLSVTGETIMPREPQRLHLKAGKGVRVEKNRVYSTKAGRPMVKKVKRSHLFYIEPHLVQHRDIDISVGNQIFRGNITIYGNVQDGMKVRAGGGIQVSGHINRATVVAFESVRAEKCFGAKVQAGGDSYYLGNCYFIMQELHKNLTGLSKAMQVIIEHPQLSEYKAKLGLLLLLLIEKKFPDVPRLFHSALELLELIPVDFPPEIFNLIELIKENIPPRNLTEEKLKTLIDYIEFTEDFFAELRNVSADVGISYAINSTISASNDIIITGQGCFSSNLTAGGNVRIANVIRGGTVQAMKDITVREAGSEIGIQTLLKTNAQGRIRILRKAYDGVIINIGGLIHEITEPSGAMEFSQKEYKLSYRKL